jgi:AraC-like DNA-binding protein
MDILASLLKDFGVRRRKLGLRGLADGVALRFPCDRSIGFHVVTRGHVFLHSAAAGGVVELAAGDIAFMARGCDHLLSHRATLSGSEVRNIDASQAVPDEGGDAGSEPDVAVISGAYQLWSEPVHPAFRELPAWLVLRGHALPRLGPVSLSAALLGQEAARREPGADLIVQSLLDMLFVYLLREVLAQQAATPAAAWAEAMRDPPVRRAVELMHEDCARTWTLEDLAREVGLSRTLLAERFRTRMGDTPLNHLRTIRIQRAMRLLADTDHKLEAVAAEVGYGDAFSFSKAFRRAVGLAPGEFRQRDRADRRVPWRFAPAEALGVPG